MTPTNKPTRTYQIDLLPYLTGNAQGEISMVLPPRTYVVDGINICVEHGQFYVKDAHGAYVFSAPVEMVRHCIVLINKRIKKRLKVT